MHEGGGSLRSVDTIAELQAAVMGNESIGVVYMRNSQVLDLVLDCFREIIFRHGGLYADDVPRWCVTCQGAVVVEGPFLPGKPDAKGAQEPVLGYVLIYE